MSGFSLSPGAPALRERVVGDLAGRDRAVEIEQAAVRLVRVVRDRARPAVRRGDRLVQLRVQVAKVAPGAVVDLVVELRQTDLALEADLRAASVEAAGDVGDLAEPTGRPGEGAER